MTHCFLLAFLAGGLNAQAPDPDDPSVRSDYPSSDPPVLTWQMIDPNLDPDQPLPKLEYAPPSEEEAREHLARLPAFEPVDEHRHAWVRLPLIWDQLTDRETRYVYLLMSRMEGVGFDILLGDVQEMRRLAASASRSLAYEDAWFVYDSARSMREKERAFWSAHLPKVPSPVRINEASGATPTFGGGGPGEGGKSGPIKWIEIGNLSFGEFRDICDREPLTGWALQG